MIYSASKLEVYDQCAKKFKAIYLDGVENKSPQMERGTLIHKEVESGIVSVSKWIPKSKDFAKFSVMQEAYVVRQDGSTPVVKEQFLTVDASWRIVPDNSEQAWLCGKIDGCQIIWDMDRLLDGTPVDYTKIKKIFFFDWKTGKSLGSDLQMGIYLLLLMAKYNLPTDKFEGIVVNLDTGKEKSYLRLNPADVKEKVNDLVRRIENEEHWQPNVNWFCSYCPVYKSCEAHQKLSEDTSFLKGVLNA